MILSVKIYLQNEVLMTKDSKIYMNSIADL